MNKYKVTYQINGNFTSSMDVETVGDKEDAARRVILELATTIPFDQPDGKITIEVIKVKVLVK